jgi:orc1/cdc6 family replication initiation protein
MITDARPLQPEFVPGDIRHRDGEINALTSTLTPITHGDYTEPALLHGPSGTGKTCIAQYAIDQLCREVVNIDTQYVNCWEDYTRFKTLYRVLEGVDASFDIHRQSTPRDELLERLRNVINDPYAVILDEVDQLQDKKVLYDLYRINGLSLVLIANSDEELFAEIGERVSSRFKTATRIHFDRYRTSELVGILEDRISWGLHNGAVTDTQIRLVAESAGGDARVAIGTLRAAAQRAEQRNLQQLTEKIIEGAAPEAKAEIRQKNLDKLTDDQQALYNIIQEEEEVAPSSLYDRYCKKVEDPKSQRMVRKYLKKMRRYNLVTADGEGKARAYSPIK